MRKGTTKMFCGYEIKFERDKSGVVATAIHRDDTIIIGDHRETVADALYGMRETIKSIECHPYPLRPECPPPLQMLYDKALHFLDKQSAVHDQYWAAGIVKAIDRSFPKLSNPVPRVPRQQWSVRELGASKYCRVVSVGSPPFPAIVCEDGQMLAKLQHIWHAGRRFAEIHCYRQWQRNGVENIGPTQTSQIATWFDLLKVPHLGSISLHQGGNRKVSWMVAWRPDQQEEGGTETFVVSHDSFAPEQQ